MLPVVDEPLIQYAIEEARAAGIEQFCMVTGRGKTALVEHSTLPMSLWKRCGKPQMRLPKRRIVAGHRLPQDACEPFNPLGGELRQTFLGCAALSAPQFSVSQR